MKKIVLISICIFLTSLIIAQTKGPQIEWDKTTYEFGSILENEGVRSGEFIFTNTGDAPLVLTSVKASCGCTATEYSKEPVAPGERGFIKANYNPKNRPGSFNKQITVTSNTERPTTILHISGQVIPGKKTIEDIYTKEYGTVRVKTGHLSFPKVYINETVVDTIGIVNMSNKPAEIKFESVPEHLEISVTPSVLAGKKEGSDHGEIGVITVKYNGALKNDWGFLIDRVDIVINGEKINQNRLAISATIEENFSHLTEDELANAPKIEFKDLVYNFGKVQQGDSKSFNFEFTNTGKSDLVIRKYKASCGCTVTKPEKMVIKPGESSYIETKFNSKGKKGGQNNQITIITNAPNNPTIYLKMEGEVITPN